MQNKLLVGGSDKDHEAKRGGFWLWLKRIKGGGSHSTRARGKEFSLFTLLTIMFFTALIWSYEPHLATLLSPQEQFGLPAPDIAKQEQGLVREPLLRAELEVRSKPTIVSTEKTNDSAYQETISEESSATIPGLSAIQGPTTTKEFSDTEGYLATKKQVKELHKEPLPSYDNEESENKANPLVESVEYIKPVAKESFPTKEASRVQESNVTHGPSAYEESYDAEGSLTRQKEDQDLSSTTYKNKDSLAKSLSNNVGNTKSLAKESIALEGSFMLQGSSPIEASLGIEKEDNVSRSSYEKKEDVAKSEDRLVQETLIIRTKTDQDKPKTQIDNVENQKPVANESSVLIEPFATQDSIASKGPSEAKGASIGKGSLGTKKEDKVSKSTSEKKACNYAKGAWVFDDRRPLYSGFKCKRFLSWMFACRLTTRPDFRFEQYRWQPENCDMPEFDRSSFLKRMQNKTIAFVGDSLGRQQFQSLMCMLTGGEESPEVEEVGHEYGITPKNVVYRFPQTNTTILYYWSSCLCDLVPYNTSDPDAGVAMHLDRPPSFLSNNLDRIDVLVLNTGHHWSRGKFKFNRWIMHINGKPNEDSYLSNIGNAKNFTIFNMAKWVDSRLSSHPRGLKAFFRTISPRHFFGGDWNTGGSCENTTPLARGTEVNQDESTDMVVANAVKGTKVNVLDITAVSALRDEGHISKYGHKADSGIRDCLHWCLPGIPDTWNEILAAQI